MDEIITSSQQNYKSRSNLLYTRVADGYGRIYITAEQIPWHGYT